MQAFVVCGAGADDWRATHTHWRGRHAFEVCVLRCVLRHVLRCLLRCVCVLRCMCFEVRIEMCIEV